MTGTHRCAVTAFPLVWRVSVRESARTLRRKLESSNCFSLLLSEKRWTNSLFSLCAYYEKWRKKSGIVCMGRLWVLWHLRGFFPSNPLFSYRRFFSGQSAPFPVAVWPPILPLWENHSKAPFVESMPLVYLCSPPSQFYWPWNLKIHLFYAAKKLVCHVETRVKCWDWDF